MRCRREADLARELDQDPPKPTRGNHEHRDGDAAEEPTDDDPGRAIAVELHELRCGGTRIGLLKGVRRVRKP
jgi:hypothetical protein